MQRVGNCHSEEPSLHSVARLDISGANCSVSRGASTTQTNGSMPSRRIAIVGLGEAGYEMHLPALAQMKHVSVVGGCDLDVHRRARAEEKFSIPVFADLDSMLEAVRAHVLIVATPPDNHAAHCLQAIGKGLNVICEKPFVSTLDEADMVIEAAVKAGRRISVNHEFREMPIFRAVMESAGPASGEDIYFAQVWQSIDLPQGAETGWRGQMQHRTLQEAGVHLVDFVLALFGEKPVAVWASVSDGGTSEGASDALSIVSLEFTRGRLAQVLLNRLSKGEPHYFEVRADTRTASYRASFGGRARMITGLYRSTRPSLRIEYGTSGIAWREVGNERTMLARNPGDPRVASTRRVFEKSLDAFDSGGTLPSSAAGARDALEVINACYAAAETGRRMVVGRDSAGGPGVSRAASTSG